MAAADGRAGGGAAGGMDMMKGFGKKMASDHRRGHGSKHRLDQIISSRGAADVHVAGLSSGVHALESGLESSANAVVAGAKHLVPHMEGEEGAEGGHLHQRVLQGAGNVMQGAGKGLYTASGAVTGFAKDSAGAVTGLTMEGMRAGLSAGVAGVNLGVSSVTGVVGAGGVLVGAVGDFVGELITRDDPIFIGVSAENWKSHSVMERQHREALKKGADGDPQLEAELEAEWERKVAVDKLKALCQEWDTQGVAEEKAVEYLLDSLPEDPMDMSNQDFVTLTGDMNAQGELVQKDLAEMCSLRRQDFMNGLDRVRQMEEQLVVAKFVCSKGRQFLRQASLQLKEGDVVSHFRRKQVLQEVIVLLSAVLEALDRQERMADALSGGTPDFELANKLGDECWAYIASENPIVLSRMEREVRALEMEATDGVGGATGASRAAIARARFDLSKAVSKLDCAKDIADRLREIERKAGGKQGEAMQELCKNFHETAFMRIIRGNASQRTLWKLGIELDKCYRRAIDDGLRHVLFSTVAASSDADAQMLLELPYEELLVHLKEDAAFKAMVSCLGVLSNIMISFRSALQACRDIVPQQEEQRLMELTDGGVPLDTAKMLLKTEKDALTQAIGDTNAIITAVATAPSAEDPKAHAETPTIPEDESAAMPGNDSPHSTESAHVHAADPMSSEDQSHASAEDTVGMLPGTPQNAADERHPAGAHKDGARSPSRQSLDKEHPHDSHWGDHHLSASSSKSSSSMFGRMKGMKISSSSMAGAMKKFVKGSEELIRDSYDIAIGEDVPEGQAKKPDKAPSTQVPLSAVLHSNSQTDVTKSVAKRGPETVQRSASVKNVKAQADPRPQPAMVRDAVEALVEKIKKSGYELGHHNAIEDSTILLEMLYITRTQVWDDIQSKIRLFLQLQNLHKLRLEEYTRIITATNRFISFGEGFSEREATLRGTVWSQSRDYYKAFHRTKVTTLQTSMENDYWHPYPCDGELDLTTVQELRPFLCGKGVVPHDELPFGDAANQWVPMPGGAYRNPFADYTDDSKLSAGGEGPSGGAVIARRSDRWMQVLTGSTLKTVRLFGEYMHVMSILRPVAHDAMKGLIQLFEYYLYTVADIFTPTEAAIKRGAAGKCGGGIPSLRVNASHKLLALLDKIELQFIGRDGQKPTSGLATVKNVPTDLTSTDSLYGVGERCVAIESLVFLSDVAYKIKDPLLKLVHPKTLSLVESFFTNTVDVVGELREAMCRLLPLTTVRMDDVKASMLQVKWDAAELGVHHSPYVDTIHGRFVDLFSALDQMEQFLPPMMRPLIIRGTAMHVMEQLVDGFSKIRRVGPNTPLIMSNDLTTLKSSLEQLTRLKPFPFAKHAEAFVKAYFLEFQETEVILEWARQHPCYTSQQIAGLVQAIGNQDNSNMFMMGNSAPVKQLLAQLQEITKNYRAPSAIISVKELAGIS